MPLPYGNYLLIGLLALVAACSHTEGSHADECRDGADNDGNGLFDCEDTGCVHSPDCAADTDSDADADTDSDTDSDTDADSDTDTDAPNGDCYPGDDCSDETPPDIDGSGGTTELCLASPTGAYPPVFTQQWHLDGYDVAGTKIYAVAAGTIRAGNDRWGSRECYSEGMCFGSVNCPCTDDDKDGNYVQEECSTTNPHYTGGSYSYTTGLECYNDMCASDACATPDLPETVAGPMAGRA